MRAFVDRTVSPSFVDDVVMATTELLRVKAASGLYHCVNGGYTTWVGIAQELARLVGRDDAVIEEIQMAALRLKAERPLFAALSNQKLTDAGVVMPSWQDALARYVAG